MTSYQLPKDYAIGWPPPPAVPAAGQARQVLSRRITRLFDLTPTQRKSLPSARLQAFPSWADCPLLADLELGINLAAQTTEQNNVAMAALDLIYWALKEGRLADLLAGMAAQRPHNPQVAALTRELAAPPAVSGLPPGRVVPVTI